MNSKYSLKFANSGNTLKVSIFCIIWQCLERSNILHILAVLWKLQQFECKRIRLWHETFALARSIFIFWLLLISSSFLVSYSTKVSSACLLRSLFFAILLLSTFYLLLLQTFGFCAFSEEQSAVKQCAWGKKTCLIKTCSFLQKDLQLEEQEEHIAELSKDAYCKVTYFAIFIL